MNQVSRGMSKYKRYPAYKDSGVEWIGEVPDGWEVKPICRVASCNDDALSENTPADAVLRYVDISAVNHADGITQVTEVRFADAPSRARRQAKSGDVVVSTVRTYLKAVAAVTEDYAGCIYSTGFAVLRARSAQVDPAFLKWMALNNLLIQAIEAHSEGLSYPAINATELVKLKAVVPPPAEQSTIAAFLGRETTRIDALIAKKTRFIELLKEKRQALITHAVTKGLDSNVKMKDSGVEWIGGVPEHWKIAPLWSVYRPVKRIGFTDEPLLSVYRDYGVVLKASRDDNRNRASDDLGPYQLVEPGQLVTNKMKTWQGSIAVSEFRGIVSPAYFIYEPIRNVFGRFIHHLMRCGPYITGYMSISKGIRVGQWDLDPDHFRVFPVLFPPKKEQERIVAFLDRETTRIDALTAKTQCSIDLLKERRSAFITAAVTGQIDLRGEIA